MSEQGLSAEEMTAFINDTLKQHMERFVGANRPVVMTCESVAEMLHVDVSRVHLNEARDGFIIDPAPITYFTLTTTIDVGPEDT